MPLFIVQLKSGGPKRLVKADRRSQAESYVLQDYSIEKASAEQAADLASNGTKVEQVA